jgi:hypothetical protein
MIEKTNPNTPHIKFVRSYWEIHSTRKKSSLVALTAKFARLKDIGPWRKYTEEWFGDTKKPV